MVLVSIEFCIVVSCAETMFPFPRTSLLGPGVVLAIDVVFPIREVALDVYQTPVFGSIDFDMTLVVFFVVHYELSSLVNL